MGRALFKMEAGWTIGGLGMLGAALGLWIGVSLWHAGADRAPAAVDPATPIAAAAPSTGPAWLAGDPLALVPAAPPASVATLAAHLAQLDDGAGPQEAYRAWWLINACVVFERSGRLPAPDSAAEEAASEPIPDPARFCAGMNERMRMARIDYLERAVRGGIEGALPALVEAGPFGDPGALLSRPGDPLVQEWKARINGLLDGRAEQGQWTSLYVLFTGFWFENPAIAADRQSALAYGMALRDIMVTLDGLSEQDAIPFNGPFLDSVRAGLSPEQVAQAGARAARIVARAAAQREAARRPGYTR